MLIGGAPIRVLRLSPRGAALVAGWRAGEPVGAGAGAGALAARLVEGGLARARPGGTSPPLSMAVVVPVRDDRDGLAETLLCLERSAPGVTVAVVDDGSKPPLLPPAGRCRLLRREGTGGPAAARNTGLEALSDDVVVFVDAGCRLEDGCLAGLLRHFADPGVAAAAPRVLSRPARTLAGAVAAYEAVHSALDMGPAASVVRPGAAVSYVPTAVLAVRRRALTEVGGFDERLRFGEDVDLVWRLAAAGWRVHYDPAVRASHPSRPNRRRWLRQRYDYGRSATPLAARHGRAAAPVAVSPWSAGAWLAALGGHAGLASIVAAASAATLAGRAGRDGATTRELLLLAARGHIRAAGPLAMAVRRAWLPPAAVLAGLLGATGPSARRRVSLAAAAVLVGPGLADWARHRPPASPASWCLAGLADDLAYQAGVWAGASRARSPAALIPRW